MSRHALDDHTHVGDLHDVDLRTDPIHTAMSAVRQAVVDGEDRADERATAIVDRRARRYWLPRIALASAVAAAFAVTVVLALLGPQIAALRNTDSDLIAESREIRALVAGAAVAGEQANDELEAQGLPQVPIAQPGTAPDSDVLVDAATAQVLASLPAQVAAEPSAEDLAEAVAAYFVTNPVMPAGPSAAALSVAVAEFLAANPIPVPEDGEPGQDGEQGPTGERGPSPTAQEIQAALGVFLADNPNTLCPRGGTFALVEGAVTLDGPRDFWVCVVPSTAPDPPMGDVGGGAGELGGGSGGGSGILGGIVGG